VPRHHPTPVRELLERFSKATRTTPASFLAQMESTTHLKRLITLAELGNAAAFLVSDRASAMTGTVVNLTGGTVVD
jgi:enoyl-[acyl-carrier-protein] reductase (NADH)